MKINMFKMSGTSLLLLAGGIAATMAFAIAPAQAQIDMKKRPSLVITNERAPATPTTPYNAPAYTPPLAPAPLAPVASAYGQPSKNRDITPMQISGNSYYQPTRTIVAGKVDELRNDLNGLEGRVSSLSSQLKSMQSRSQSLSAEYNASIATINTQLQTGTTPGNPRLVQKLSVAQGNLDRLSQNVADLNSMAVEAANAASMGSFLLEACRSAYGLSGAVEEDHAALAQVEDEVNNTIISIDRLLNEVNDDISRTAAYLSAERDNIRTLSLAVTNGDYYGRSLASRPFSSAPAGPMIQPASLSPSAGSYPAVGGSASPSSPRPLVKIRFDQPNVDYQQAVYMAVSEAMQRYPSARFELIAVNPTGGNAAQVAIESTRARRNAEAVLRSLQQMGVDINRIDLSTQQSAEAKSSEVHIFIR